MTVATTKSRNIFSGNGSTQVFPLDYEFNDEEDLIVTVVDADGNEDLQVLTTDYTVSGGDGETGSVTILTAPATGTTVVIERDEPAVQGTDLVRFGVFPAESVEARFDAIVMMVQRTFDLLRRVPVLVKTREPTDPSPTLPEPVDGEILVGKTDGSGWENAELTALDPGLVSLPLSVNQGGTAATTASGARTNLRVQSDLEIFNVKDFGAAGDAATDDAAAVQAAVDAAEAAGGGIVFFPSGTYLLSATITVETKGVKLVGSGAISTVLEGTHSSGAVVHIAREHCGVLRMTVDASSARQSGGAGSNYGILHDRVSEAAGDRGRYGEYYAVTVRNQPNHGFVFVGTINFTLMEQLDATGNAGHGFFFDNGTETGRATIDKIRPGLCTMHVCTSIDNEGNGLVIGGESEDTNLGVRITLDNCEFIRNAESAGTRKSADQVWAFCDQLIVRNSAFGGMNQAGDTATTRGMLVAGRDIYCWANRFLDVTPQALRVADLTDVTTAGVTIDGIFLSGNLQSSLDPAVTVDPGAATGLWVNSSSTQFMTAMVFGAILNEPVRKIPRMIRKNVDQSVTASTVLVNDDQLVIPMLANQTVEFRAYLQWNGPSAGDIKFAFNGPAGLVLRWSTASGTRVDTTGAVGAIATLIAADATLTLAADSATRSVELVGSARTTGTAGNLVLRFAQNASDASPTTLEEESHIEYWQM